MNRLIKVNDTLLFASGFEIWKYNSRSTGIVPIGREVSQFAFLNCHLNPVNNSLTVNVTITKPTHVLINLLDKTGNFIKIIDSAPKPKGVYQYQIDTGSLAEGIYFVALKTHEDQPTVKVMVTH